MSQMDAASVSSPLPVELADVLDPHGLVDVERFAYIEALLVEEGRWEDLAALYEAAVARAPDPEAGRRYQLLAGLLWSEKLESPRLAESWLRRVLASDPEHTEALSALKDLCATSDRLLEAADLLDRAIGVASSEDKPDLLLALGDLVYPALQDPNRALEALRYAYELDPTRIDVVSAARRVFVAERRWLDAKQVLDDQAKVVVGDASDGTTDVGGVGPQAAAAGETAALASSNEDAADDPTSTEPVVAADADAAEHSDPSGPADASAVGTVAAEPVAEPQVHENDSRSASSADDASLDTSDQSSDERSGESGEASARVDGVDDEAEAGASKSADDEERSGQTAGVPADEPVEAEAGSRQSTSAESGSAEVGPGASPADVVSVVSAVTAGEGAGVAARTVDESADPVVSLMAPSLNDDANPAVLGAPEQSSPNGETSSNGEALSNGHLVTGSLAVGTPIATADIRRDTVDMAGEPPEGEAGQAIRAVRELADGYLELGLKLMPHAMEHALAESCLEAARKLGQQAALSRLDELAHLRQTWEDSAERLRVAGFEARDKQAAAQCYLQAAELVQAYGQASVRADEFLERCLLLVPGYGPALDFLESTHSAQNRLSDLVRRMNAMVGAVRDPGAKVEILLRVARLSQLQMAEAEVSHDANEARARALNAYRRVLAIRPEHREAVQQSCGLLSEQNQAADRAQILESYLAATAEPYAQVQTHLELGRLYAEDLGDSSRSRAHFEAVVTRDPTNFAAASALGALYKDSGEHAALLGVLRVLLQYAPDRSTRLEMLHQMAEVASSVGPEESFSVLRQIFELDPDGTHERLVTAAEALQRFLPLAQSYVTAARTNNGDRAIKMWLAAGQLFDERLPRPRDAIHAYREALRLDGRNDDARQALERLLAQQDDPEALLEVLRSQLADVEDEAGRALLLARIGGILDRDLGRFEEAVATFGTVLEIDPQHSVALANLDDLYRRQEDWPALERVLLRRESIAESEEERTPLVVRRARLLAGPLDHPDDGALLMLELLGRAPDHPQVLEGLAALVDRGVQPLAIARALEPIYAQRGQYGPQVDMLAQLAEHAETVEARATAARRAAQVAETRMNDPQRAFELVATGLRGTPDNEELVDTLIRLGHETQSTSAAADVLAPLVEAETRPEVVATLAYRLGELREDALGDAAGAIEAYRTTLDADGQHPQAVAALERLLGHAERYEELASLLESRLAGAEDAAAKIQFGLALATLQDARLNEPDKAAETIASLLSEQPREPMLLGRLAELQERLERWRELVGTLDRLRDGSDDPEVKVGAETKAAEVLARHLGDMPEAVERFRSVFASRPAHGPAVRGLEALLEDVEIRASAGEVLSQVYEDIGDAAGLVRALEAQLASTSDPETRKALFVRMADVQSSRLDDPGGAFEALTRAFQEGLLEPKAIERLSDLAAVANRSKALAQVYEHAIEKDPESVELLRELARLYDGAAGAPSRAKETWQRVLEHVPGDAEALEALERLTTAGDRPEALAVVLVARAEAAEELDTKVAFYKRAAAVFEETAHDVPQALKTMERAKDVRPADRSIWQELARYHQVLGQPEARRDALAAEVELVEAPLERARVLVALAETKISLDDHAGAIETYEAALDVQPEHPEARAALEGMLTGPEAKRAAAALEPVYRRAGDWARLVETYETMVERAVEPADRVERLMAIRSIYEERLARPDRAFEAAGRAFVEAPEHPDTLSALERLGRACGAVDELMQMLERHAATLPVGHPRRVELWVKLADLAEHTLGDPQRAIEMYGRAHVDDPTALAPLVELDRLYAHTGDARGQVATRQALANLVTTPVERAGHLTTAAQILDDRLGDRRAAIRAYEQVLEHVPGHEEALDRLDMLYTEGHAYVELGRVLATQARHGAGARRAQALLRLGELRRDQLQDPRGAIAAFGDVLDMDPEEASPKIWETALQTLDALMGQLKDTQPGLAADAGLRLEPHWLARADATKLISAKEAQVAAHADPVTRRRLLFDVADLYERELGKSEMAFMCLARAFVLSPNDVELTNALDRVAPVAGTEEELADLYAQTLSSIEDQNMALRLARRGGEIYDQILDRPEAAAPMYSRVLALSPDDPAALNALERLYRRTDDSKGLLTVYRSMLRRAGDDPEQTEALWRRMAEVADSTDSDATFEAYRALLERRPDDLPLLRKMAALCERTGRLEDLWTTLEREAQVVTETDEKAQVFLRMGTLARAELHDDSRAVEAFACALQARPGDPGAVAGLAAIVREEGPARPLAATALAPVYRSSGAFEAFITCLEIQGSAKPAGEERKQIYLEIADVYENRLARPERAFTWGCRALHEDLTDDEVASRVEGLASTKELLEELAAFYLDALEDVRAPELNLKLRRRVADLYDKNLRAPVKAIEAYNRVLDMAPGDAEALVALARLLPEVGQFGSLGDVYRRRIAQAADRDVRIQLLRQFALLQADQLSDGAGAIATLRRLLELVPGDVPALEMLASLCDEENRTAELIETLEALVDAAGAETATGRDARVRLAQLKAGPHGDLAAAETLLRAVVAEAPDHPGAREFLQERFEDAVAEDDVDVAQRVGDILADALRETEAWPDLISVLRVRAGLRDINPHDRVALNREAAERYRDCLGQTDLAFTTFAQVLQDSPGLDDVREDLEKLADELDLQDALVEALEVAREGAVDGEVRARLARRIAQLVTAHMHDPERAAAWWHAVLTESPDDPEALAALDPLFTDLGRWAALTDVLERRVELTEDDPDLQFSLFMRLAGIWEEWLGEQEEAAVWYQRAQAIRPDDPAVLEALTRLIDPETDPEAMYDILERLSAQMADVPSRVQLWARMAKLVDERLDRPEDAIHWWSQVRRVNPNHTEAVEALERLYERTNRWQELADLLQAQLTEAPDERTMLRLQRRLGLVRGTRLGSVEEAVRAWTEILKRNPNDVEALEAVCQIYREAERWDDLVANLRKLIPMQLDPGGVKAIRFELAEVYRTHLDSKEDAIESAKRVLDVEPHTVVELKRLEEIFLVTGAHAEAVKVMNARAGYAETRGQRIEILFDIARVYEEQIGPQAGTAAAYEQILELEPTSQKAYDALGRIYKGAGDYRKLGELYNRRLLVTEQPEERRELLSAIVEIQERWLGQPELAFTVACRAFGEEGADPEAQEVAERLADETDNWDVLAEVYEEQVDLVPAARAVELRRRLAEIRLDHLDEYEEAETQFRVVLSMRPDDEVARDRLIRMFGQQQRWSDLIEQLTDRVELAGEVDEKKRLLREIATLHEQNRGDAPAAIAVLRRSLEIDAEDDDALVELGRLYRAEQMWPPLLSVLERRLERASAEDEILGLRTEIAGVLAQGVKDVPRAIEAYRDVLKLAERHPPALAALEQLLVHEERWSDLIENYDRQVAMADADDQAIAVLTKMATIYEERFKDLGSASRTLIRVLEIDPEHRPTLVSLSRVWRNGREWSSLIEALERQVELSSDPAERISLLRQIGEVWLRHLEQVDHAEEAYNRALAMAPDDDR